MSRTPNSRREETHERIVDAAARALRRHGVAGVGVAEVMKEAGLTHGGFYAHFPSREALLVAALERAGRDSAATVANAIDARRVRGTSPFRALVEAYLSEAHATALEVGCPVAALGADLHRQQGELQAASRSTVEGLVRSVRATLPGATQAAATVIASTMVGALQIARALGEPAGSAALAAARQTLLLQHDEPPAG